MTEGEPVFILIGTSHFIDNWFQENKKYVAFTIKIDYQKKEGDFIYELKQLEDHIYKYKRFRMIKVVFQDGLALIHKICHGGTKEKLENDLKEAKEIRVKYMKRALNKNYDYIPRKYRGYSPKPLPRKIQNEYQTDFNLVNSELNKGIYADLKGECQRKGIDIELVNNVDYNVYEYPKIILNQVLEILYEYYKTSLEGKPLNESGFTQKWIDEIMKESLIFIPYPLLINDGYYGCPDQRECNECRRSVEERHVFKQARHNQDYYKELVPKFQSVHPKIKKKFVFTEYFENLKYESMPTEFVQQYRNPDQVFAAIFENMRKHECKGMFLQSKLEWEDHQWLIEAAEENKRMLNQKFENDIIENTIFTTQEKILTLKGYLEEAYESVVPKEKPRQEYISPETMMKMMRNEVINLFNMKTNEERRRQKEFDVNATRISMIEWEHMFHIMRMDAIEGKTEEAVKNINSFFEKMTKEKERINFHIRSMWLKFKKDELNEEDRETMEMGLFSTDESNEEYKKLYEERKKILDEEYVKMKRNREEAKRYAQGLTDLDSQICAFSDMRNAFLSQQAKIQNGHPDIEIIQEIQTVQKEEIQGVQKGKTQAIQKDGTQERQESAKKPDSPKKQEVIKVAPKVQEILRLAKIPKKVDPVNQNNSTEKRVENELTDEAPGTSNTTRKRKADEELSSNKKMKNATEQKDAKK